MIDSAAVLVAYLIHVVRHVLNIALALRVYASHTDVDTPKLTALVTYAPCEYVRAIDVSGIRAHDAMTKKQTTRIGKRYTRTDFAREQVHVSDSHILSISQ